MKHLYKIYTIFDQRRICWADVVQMLYKCFVFAGYVNAASVSVSPWGTMTLCAYSATECKYIIYHFPRLTGSRGPLSES